MKTTSKKQENCQVELQATFDAEEMKAIIKDVEKVFAKEAQVPGFRKGKVPMDMIRKNFANELKQEIESTFFRKNIEEAIAAEKLDRITISDVKELSATAEGGSFTAIVEVKPEFKLPTYKGLKIEFKDTTVSDEELNQTLTRYREALANYEDAKEGETVSAGDFIQIDYTGTVDGKPITEINAEAKVVASGTGFWTQVEEGRFLPEILDAVKGMKIGETKEGVKAKFDKETAPEGLKGAKALYTVTVKAFRRRVLPTDAEFVEKAQEESLEKLTANIRARMEESKATQEKERRETEAIELLLKKCDFEVPPSNLTRARDAALQDFVMRAQSAGIPAEYFEKNREQILKDAEENAVKQVRLWYLIDAIAQAEKIEEADERARAKKVFAFLVDNAKK